MEEEIILENIDGRIQSESKTHTTIKIVKDDFFRFCSVNKEKNLEIGHMLYNGGDYVYITIKKIKKKGKRWEEK